ncbi:PucR family transcriptional regulator [Slackia heliotrinireducens]|uniref:PucR family transcriptional regulator n=1 Tax=Slackia heliotrinireducens TaxID=84110 RepID=UPI00331524A5
MYYTVSDFSNAFESNLTLIAGSGGMARTVREVGILDYELMPGIKTTYQRVNFYENQLVLTTFLYAKENPYLILDAIKYLVAQGTSGLVIKNVLHLAIPEAAIRYANARNFPVFTTHGELMFDNVIMDVGNAVKRMETTAFVQQQIDALLQAQDEIEQKHLALRLNPSLRGEVAALYSPAEDELIADQFARYQLRFERSKLFGPGSSLLCYRNGLLLIVSRDEEGPLDIDRTHAMLRADILNLEESAIVGISSIHFGPAETTAAITEALQCACIARLREVPEVRYDSLGPLQALLPHALSPQTNRYAERILNPIREFDAENNGQLMTTLQTYCNHGQNIAQAAEALEQHPNTIRYRLEKVYAETGLSYKNPADMQQLALACNIDFCRRVGQEVG